MFEFKYPEFSARMQAAADHAGGEFISRSRNVALAKALTESTGKKTNPDTARRWFEGFAMPRYKMIPAIAEAMGVSAEWLETGRGEMIGSPAPALRAAHLDRQKIFGTPSKIADITPASEDINAIVERFTRNSSAAQYVAALLSCGGIPAVANSSNVTLTFAGVPVTIACVGVHEMDSVHHEGKTMPSVYVFFNDRLDVPRLAFFPADGRSFDVVFENDIVVTDFETQNTSMSVAHLMKLLAG